MTNKVVFACFSVAPPMPSFPAPRRNDASFAIMRVGGKDKKLSLAGIIKGGPQLSQPILFVRISQLIKMYFAILPAQSSFITAQEEGEAARQLGRC